MSTPRCSTTCARKSFSWGLSRNTARIDQRAGDSLMTTAADFAPGNYRFIPGVFQYSGGAAAHDGYAIERVRFHALVPLKEGFARIAKIIGAAGRPLTAFCACELRSPAPFTEDGFRAFNQIYVVTL